ncbi:MAG TPA: hypothetical protein VD902_22640 [Symbiobacteriaceae bacterium]|nr:hypothetical protein [Symbiobacteriaceae bacterium]
METKQSDGMMTHTRLTIGAAALLAAAGVFHLALAPGHWSHSPAHGLSLAVMGILEILWSVAFWRKPSVGLSRFGLLISLGLVTLWAITRVGTAPFGHGHETVDAWGVIIKVCEVLGAAALVPMAMSPGAGRMRYRAVVAVAAAAVIGAWGTYGVALAAEPLFPACDLATGGQHQDHADHANHHADHHAAPAGDHTEHADHHADHHADPNHGH